MADSNPDTLHQLKICDNKLKQLKKKIEFYETKRSTLSKQLGKKTKTKIVSEEDAKSGVLENLETKIPDETYNNISKEADGLLRDSDEFKIYLENKGKSLKTALDGIMGRKTVDSALRVCLHFLIYVLKKESDEYRAATNARGTGGVVFDRFFKTTKNTVIQARNCYAYVRIFGSEALFKTEVELSFYVIKDDSQYWPKVVEHDNKTKMDEDEDVDDDDNVNDNTDENGDNSENDGNGSNVKQDAGRNDKSKGKGPSNQRQQRPKRSKYFVYFFFFLKKNSSYTDYFTVSKVIV
jgi:hypothetical protein